MEEQKAPVVNDMQAILATVKRIENMIHDVQDIEPLDAADDLIKRYEVEEDDTKDSIQTLIDTYLTPMEKREQKEEEEKKEYFNKELGLKKPTEIEKPIKKEKEIEKPKKEEKVMDEEEILKQFDVDVPPFQESIIDDAIGNKLASKLAELREKRKRINQLLRVQEQFDTKEPFKNKETLQKEAEANLLGFDKAKAELGASSKTKEFLDPLKETKKYLEETGALANVQMTGKAGDIIKDIHDKAVKQKELDDKIFIGDVLEIGPHSKLENFSDEQLDQFMKEHFIPIRKERKHKIEDVKQYLDYKEALKQLQKVKGVPQALDYGAIPQVPRNLDMPYYQPRPIYKKREYQIPKLNTQAINDITSYIRRLRASSIKNLAETLGLYYSETTDSKENLIKDIQNQTISAHLIKPELLRYEGSAYVVLKYLGLPHSTRMTLKQMKDAISSHLGSKFVGATETSGIYHRKPTNQNYKDTAKIIGISNYETLDANTLEKEVDKYFDLNAHYYRDNESFQSNLDNLDIYFVSLIANKLGIKTGRKSKNTLIDQITGTSPVSDKSRYKSRKGKLRAGQSSQRKFKYKSVGFGKVLSPTTKYDSTTAKKSVDVISLGPDEGFVNARDLYDDFDMDDVLDVEDIIKDINGRHHLNKRSIWNLCAMIGLDVKEGRTWKQEVLYEVKYRLASFPLNFEQLNARDLTRNTYFNIIAILTGTPEPIDNDNLGYDEQIRDSLRKLKKYNRQSRSSFDSSEYLSMLAIDLGNFTMDQIHECLEFFGFIPYTSLHEKKRIRTARTLMVHSMPKYGKSYENLREFSSIAEAKKELKYYLPPNQMPSSVSKANDLVREFRNYRGENDLMRVKDAIEKARR